MTRLLTAVAVVTALVAGVVPSRAADDVDKALIGKWEGAISGLQRESPKRVLVISSVNGDEARGRWTGHPVTIHIDRSGREAVLEFNATPTNTVKLTLESAKVLEGTITMPRASGPRAFPLHLEHAE